jgi:radical SAM protein with 4Fe4S-binding SPASM domain
MFSEKNPKSNYGMHMNIIDKLYIVRRALIAQIRNEFPSALEITTIFPCSNACKFCPQDKWRNVYQGKHRLTYDEFCKVLEKIPKHVRIDFSGFSEPFLNRESSLMMQRAYQRGYQVTLYTTLVGFRQDDLDIIKDIRFSACQLHVPDDKIFKASDEDKWLEAYKLFARHVHYDTALYYLGSLSSKIKNELPNVRGINSVLTRANNVRPDIAPPLLRSKGVIKCWSSGNRFNQNVMMPNGDVYLCCMDWSLKHKLGNLFEQSYEEFHQSEEYQKICRSMSDESIETICRYCERSRSRFYKL